MQTAQMTSHLRALSKIKPTRSEILKGIAGDNLLEEALRKCELRKILIVIH